MAYMKSTPGKHTDDKIHTIQDLDKRYREGGVIVILRAQTTAFKSNHYYSKAMILRAQS